jgi:hypothetical protein
VILLRLAGLSPDRKAEITTVEMRAHANEFQSKLAVISPGRTRFRETS